MTVKELIELLSKYPDDAEVYCYKWLEEDEDRRYHVILDVSQDNGSLMERNVNDVLIDVSEL